MQLVRSKMTATFCALKTTKVVSLAEQRKTEIPKIGSPGFSFLSRGKAETGEGAFSISM